jgi:hypothetical protein
MKSISRDVAGFNLIVALLSIAVFSIAMPKDLLNTVVILGAYLPYAVFSYFLGLRFGGWYLADGETPRIFEFLGVPIIMLSINCICSSFVYGNIVFIYSNFIEESLFSASFTMDKYLYTLAAGLFSGVMFVAVTSIIQVSLLLLGSAFFILKVRKGVYAL